MMNIYNEPSHMRQQIKGNAGGKIQTQTPRHNKVNLNNTEIILAKAKDRTAKTRPPTTPKYQLDKEKIVTLPAI